MPKPPVVVHADRLYALTAADLTPAQIASTVKETGSVEAAAGQLNLSPAVVQAAVDANEAPPKVDGKMSPPAKPLETVGDLLGLITGIGALVLLLGGSVLAMRLRSADLPPEAVFAQLPRDFLITIGTSQVLAPALVLVGVHAFLRAAVPRDKDVSYWLLTFAAAAWFVMLVLVVLAATGRVGGLVEKRELDPASLPIAVIVLLLAVVSAAVVRAKWSKPGSGWRWRHGPDWLTLSIAYGIVAMIAATFVAATFPLLDARACMSSGFGENGNLVGQGTDRIFLGESVAPPRRIVSLPAGEVEELFIGANARRANCEARGQAAPVMAHAAAARARRKLRSALTHFSAFKAATSPKAQRVIADRLATAAQQSLRATEIGADAGAHLNDELRADHPDQAHELRALVIRARLAAQDTFQSVTELRELLPRIENEDDPSTAHLGTLVGQTLGRAEVSAAAAELLDREAYQASPLLVPGSLAN